jgi:hypothetical protein
MGLIVDLLKDDVWNRWPVMDILVWRAGYVNCLWHKFGRLQLDRAENQVIVLGQLLWVMGVLMVPRVLMRDRYACSGTESVSRSICMSL